MLYLLRPLHFAPLCAQNRKGLALFRGRSPGQPKLRFASSTTWHCTNRPDYRYLQRFRPVAPEQGHNIQELTFCATEIYKALTVLFIIETEGESLPLLSLPIASRKSLIPLR